MRPVVVPDTGGLNEFAGADHRRVANHGHQVTLTPRLHAQDAERIVRADAPMALIHTGSGLSRIGGVVRGSEATLGQVEGWYATRGFLHRVG